MTLVVSELRRYGVVMVADCAVTTRPAQSIVLPDGPPVTEYARTGAQKVFPVDQIQAGVSVWGRGSLDDGTPMDLWLESLLRSGVREEDTLKTLGEMLAEEANAKIAPPQDDSEKYGFHVGGFIDTDDGRLPALYHVHCGHDNGAPHELRLYQDCPDHGFCGNRVYDDMSQYAEALAGQRGPEAYWHQLRNGTYTEFAYIIKYLTGSLTELREREGFSAPEPDDLHNRARYLKLVVETVCDIYAMSTQRRHIAKPVSLLTISSEGIEDFVPTSLSTQLQPRGRSI